MTKILANGIFGTMLQSNFKEYPSIEHMCALCTLLIDLILHPLTLNEKAGILRQKFKFTPKRIRKMRRASVLNTYIIILCLDQPTEAFTSEINITPIYLNHCNLGTKPATKNRVTTIIMTVF